MRSFKPQDKNGGVYDISMDQFDETIPKHCSTLGKGILKHDLNNQPKDSSKNLERSQFSLNKGQQKVKCQEVYEKSVQMQE